jgi:hypothetical protein
MPAIYTQHPIEAGLHPQPKSTTLTTAMSGNVEVCPASSRGLSAIVLCLAIRRLGSIRKPTHYTAPIAGLRF